MYLQKRLKLVCIYIYFYRIEIADESESFFPKIKGTTMFSNENPKDDT